MTGKFYLSILTVLLMSINSCKDSSTNSSEKNTAPMASFTVSPDSGTTSTIFEFDASSSKDDEDPTSTLEVRWDWDNDGMWDTDYSKTKIYSYQYVNGGSKIVALEVRDSGGKVDSTTNHLFVSIENTAPTASFVVNSDSGNTETVFIFDASGCTDNEDISLELKVKWDWESDGTWDTDYSNVKKASHQFQIKGEYIVKMKVQDTGSLSDSTTKKIIVEPPSGTVTDIDGNVYKTIKIGEQWWMAENLKVTHYRNGDEIPNVHPMIYWRDLTTGAYDHVHKTDGSMAIVAYMGLLYNWFAVGDSRNLAPKGWHIPTDDEWIELEIYLGIPESEIENYVRGTDEGGKLKKSGTDYWQSPNTGATNETGFSALPAGGKDAGGPGEIIDPFYFGYTWGAWFWTSTQTSTGGGFYRKLLYSSSRIYRDHHNKKFGLSVRCIKD